MISIYYSTRAKNSQANKRISNSCFYKTNEIIEFINDGTHSLSKVYNIALKDANNPIIVCIHDDIHLEKGWDKKLFDYFESSDYGILGLAGTTDLPQSGIWWEDKNRMIGRVFHLQANGRYYESKYSNKYVNKILPAVCIDGLFIGVHRDRIKKDFDERFDGFHFYDIPFCVRNYYAGVNIGVITDISVKHDSIGKPNQKWFDNKAKFMSLYKLKLPLNLNVPIDFENNEVKLKNSPKLGIIIPTKDNFEYLEKCIYSLIKTKYSNYTIYIADTGSNEETLDKIKDLYQKINIGKDLLKIIRYDYYNFSKINNNIVENHVSEDTDVLLFCNDDIVMVNDAISLMIQQYNKHKKHVGTIGCRLYYGDNSIQHGGIEMFISKNNQIGLSHKGIRSYYNVSHNKEYDTLGNTGAFLMVSREVFFKLNGFTELTEECMEDVILNIDCIVNNYKNIYVGEAVCYHYESISRSKNSDKKAKEKQDFLNVLAPKIKKHILKLKKYITILK